MNAGATETRDSATSEEQVRVRAEGFTTLSKGGQRPVIDIVFIHGLGGHPESTWTSTETDLKETQIPTTNGQPTPPAGAGEPRKGIFGIGRSKKSKGQRQAKFFWPHAQLAKDFPEARILTYGYDCSVFKLFEAADRRGIIAHGDDLLSALQDQRVDSKERPTIFVVHSLGGLILKRALWASRDSASDDMKKVFECTIGILFYGTPHRGGNYADLGGALAHVVKATGHTVSPQVMNNLKHDSELLELLRKEFWKMLDADQFDIHSFYETKGLTFIRFIDQKVVDKTSATLEHRREIARSAAGNHMKMCKFTGPHDARYEAVKAIVRAFLASERVQRTQEISNCISSLKVAEMDNDRTESRLYNIVKRHGGTLNWLFQDVVTGPDGTERRHGFVPWIQGENGIFWIRGIPASGKSTAMKYIHYRMKTFRRHEKSWLHVAVFFHDRGTNEQKTMLGMLRSILRQLILGCPTWLPELIQLVAPFGRVDSSEHREKETKRRGADDWLWTVEGLQKAIIAVASQQDLRMNVFLMVDALDEHNGDHEGMIQFFQDLAAPTKTRTFKFQILLASRPDPPFNDRLRTHSHLSIHEWTEEDVKAFVTSSFKEDPSFQECLSHFHDHEDFPKMEAAIVGRARGVFLWVRLIIEDVLDQVKRRRLADVSALSKRLAKLPNDLVDLYTRILKRVPLSDSEETYILLETVLRARRPLTVLELAYVLMLGLDKISRKLDEQGSLESRLDQEKIYLIEKNAWSYLDRILGSCKGLLQVYGRYSEHPWLDENESMWSAPAYQRFVPPTQAQIYEAQVRGQPSEGPVNRSLTRKGTADTTFSDGIALPQRDSLIHHGKCPEAHWHVQLLHQSVKEYMMEEDGRNLYHLFKRSDSSDAPISNVDCCERPADNGHVYILDLCIQILRITKPFPTYEYSPSGSKDTWPVTTSRETMSILSPKTIAEWVLHNGVNAEITMRRSFMLTLDMADRYLQVELRREDWPAQITRQQYELEGWNFNFVAYAIGANMYHFVEDKLRQRPDILNAKKGRPLLFFAVWTPGGVACTEPRMVQLLLDHGADVRAQWVDGEGNKKDALRSMQYHECDMSGYPLKEIMLLLLKTGADPNLPVIGVQRRSYRPLVHQVITMDISAEAKMEILRALKKAGAEFATKDSERLRMLDLYCQRLLEQKLREELSITELEWILEAGARITAGMFDSDGFKRTLLYANELRRPSYYTYDGQKVARRDNPQWPEFSFLRRIFGSGL